VNNVIKFSNISKANKRHNKLRFLFLIFFYVNILAGAAQWLVVMAVLYITGACLYAGK
jgi:hypothetical protein